MQRKSVLFLAAGFILALLGVLSLMAQDVKAERNAALLAPTSLYSEFWKTGFTVEGAAAYSNVAGRLLSDAASFRSARNTDAYFIFPAAATTKTVTKFSYHILSRTGSYAGNTRMAIEVRSFDGTLLRTVSNIYDLEAASSNVWILGSLTAAPTDWVINTGEYLCVHFSLDGIVGGDLDVRPIFEITLR
jgi:hypothetical protein